MYELCAYTNIIMKPIYPAVVDDDSLSELKHVWLV